MLLHTYKKHAAASVVCSAPVRASAANIPVAQPASAPVAQVANPMDFANTMAATIDAALKPLQEQHEASIVPMQRTIESPQAEIIAMREEKDDADMVQPVFVSVSVLDTQEATRLRTGLTA